MKRLLIRADDLGYSRGVNYGIVDSVRGGLVGSVGVMTNMESVDHGLELLDGLDVCLGQHTNICVGRPLTDPALIPSLCGPDGMFKPSGAYRDAMKRGIDFVVLDEVVLEIEAQYRKFVSLVDREPSYFEGHAVASPAFFKGLEIVAERHGLPLFPMGAPGEAARSRARVSLRTCPQIFAPMRWIRSRRCAAPSRMRTTTRAPSWCSIRVISMPISWTTRA